MVITEPDPELQQGSDIEHTDATERVDTDHTPALHTDEVRPFQVRENQCSKTTQRKVPWMSRRRRRCVQATAMSVLFLSSFVASVIYFEIHAGAGHSSPLAKAYGTIQRLLGSSSGVKGAHQKQVLDPPSDVPAEDMLSIIILRRQEEENRFRRQEEILRRERLGRTRHARMEAQEEKRILIEEQKKVMEEKRLRVLQRQDEEKLRREEETMLRKERLAIERRARIDAHEEKSRMAQDQSEEHYIDIVQGDEAMIPQEQETETEVAEDERHPHVRRKAKLYTFAY